MPLSFSLDCVGPLARTAEDCALLLALLILGTLSLTAYPRATVRGRTISAGWLSVIAFQSVRAAP